MPEAIFQVEKLKKDFQRGKRVVHALSDVSFTLYQGETLSLVGESGCGKTSCARTLLGVYEPTGGRILWKGKDITALSHRERVVFHRENQMIFQDPYASLDPRMTVAMSVEEGMKRHFSLSPKERQKRTEHLLEAVGLTAEFASRFPHELSGGQRQRVGIARALALEPEFLACDEPIAALDVSIQAQIINLLMRLQRERGLTYLMISHDLTVVRHISDRVAVMYLGSIVELADSDALYGQPLHPYTQALLTAVPQADPDSNWLQNIVPLPGEASDSAHLTVGCRFAPRCPHATEKCRSEAPPLLDRGGGHLAACWENEIQGKGVFMQV